MGIFGRIWRLIKGWLLIGVEKAEDPEVVLAEAQEAMRHDVEKAKESAVQAIAARNQLRGVLQEQTNRAAALEARARAAIQQGEDDLARDLLVEKANLDSSIVSLKEQLATAEQAAENVKESIRRLEAQYRQRTAQRLALVAGWKQAQIQEKINKSLSGISLDSQDQAFTRAEEKIREMKAKASAREELADSGLGKKLQKLDNVVVNQQAEAELARLKAELGGGAPVKAGEDQLARLKAEMAKEQPQQQVRAGSGFSGDEDDTPPVRNIEV